MNVYQKNPLGAIYLSKLAQQYFPHITSKSALTQLHRWIKQCEPLQKRLKELHYAPYQRVLTPKQHEAVVEFLGEP